MSEQVKLIEELREAAGDHAHGEGYLAGLLKRGAAAIKDLHAEAEALRAENGRLAESLCVAHHNLSVGFDTEASLTSQLEAAQGLLIRSDKLLSRIRDHLIDKGVLADFGPELFQILNVEAPKRAAKAIAATPAPEVQAEQGERHEVVVPAKPQWAEIVAMVNEVLGSSVHKFPCENGSIVHEMTGMNFNSLSRVIDRVIHRYATPQPGPDARGLVSFALELIDGACKGGSFDGGDIQEAGVRHGLLVVEQREESCGENCACAEYGFPAECYRLTPALAAHRQAQRKGNSHDR